MLSPLKLSFIIYCDLVRFDKLTTALCAEDIG